MLRVFCSNLEGMGMQTTPSHDWVLDVLGDLLTYARQNRLPELAEGVAALIPTAAAEISASRIPPEPL